MFLFSLKVWELNGLTSACFRYPDKVSRLKKHQKLHNTTTVQLNRSRASSSSLRLKHLNHICVSGNGQLLNINFYLDKKLRLEGLINSYLIITIIISNYNYIIVI